MNINNDPNNVIVVDTSSNAGQNQHKCPMCGAPGISLNPATGMLKCGYCQNEVAPEKASGPGTDLSRLQGMIVGSGTQNVTEDAESIITLVCTSCGAEVVINIDESAHSRCHWCRNTLSVSQQISNGSVPDMVLPFYITKEAAQEEIQKFVNKRKFYAHPKFKQEFCTENIMGVYLPYMVVDINANATFKGHAEREIKKYTFNKKTYYDADLYYVERKFDLQIEGLAIISSSDKLAGSSDKTNNIINAIKPFDYENCIKWNASYLVGYASEKRDTDITDLKAPVDVKAKDIARYSSNRTLEEYDRGVRWEQEEFETKGQKWNAAYLPVWLYSYLQIKDTGENLLHYVAVNARTLKTMGSVPINQLRLLLVSSLIQLIATIIGLAIVFLGDDSSEIALILLIAGFVYYGIIYMRYRNTNERFEHEKETRTSINNVERSDVYIRRLKRQKNSVIKGANSTSVNYNNTGDI